MMFYRRDQKENESVDEYFVFSKVTAKDQV